MIQGQTLIQSLFIIEDYNTWQFVTPFCMYIANLYVALALYNVYWMMCSLIPNLRKRKRKHYFQGPKNSKN